MLNMEYARLVDADRRRVADERLRTDRLLHPEQPTIETTTPPASTNRRSHAACRTIAGPAR